MYIKLLLLDKTMTVEELGRKIFHKLVIGDYEKNMLQHYTFIIDGQLHKLGIVELIGYFGDDLFKKIEIAKSNLNDNIVEFNPHLKRKKI